MKKLFILACVVSGLGIGAMYRQAHKVEEKNAAHLARRLAGSGGLRDAIRKIEIQAVERSFEQLAAEAKLMLDHQKGIGCNLFAAEAIYNQEINDLRRRKAEAIKRACTK